MSTNKDSREDDRDQQHQDRDQKNQAYDDGHDKQAMKSDKDQHNSIDSERLQDKDHRMDRRTNDVELGDSFGEDKRHENGDSKSDIEKHWNEIKADYRKNYPNITDEDVNYRTGEFDNMTDRIAKRTNRNREVISNEIRDWNSSTQSN